VTVTVQASFPLPGQYGHRPRQISLQVEALPDGRLRVSTPSARGWAAAARTPAELARAVESAFTEVSVAAYAKAHGQPYDLDVMTSQVPGDSLAGERPARQRRARSRVRQGTYAPESWAELADGSGRWRSPSGRFYRGDSKVVRSVRAKLEAVTIRI
jgi:hypothetical protein